MEIADGSSRSSAAAGAPPPRHAPARPASAAAGTVWRHRRRPQEALPPRCQDACAARGAPAAARPGPGCALARSERQPHPSRGTGHRAKCAPSAFAAWPTDAGCSCVPAFPGQPLPPAASRGEGPRGALPYAVTCQLSLSPGAVLWAGVYRRTAPVLRRALCGGFLWLRAATELSLFLPFFVSFSLCLCFNPALCPHVYRGAFRWESQRSPSGGKNKSSFNYSQSSNL